MGMKKYFSSLIHCFSLKTNKKRKEKKLLKLDKSIVEFDDNSDAAATTTPTNKANNISAGSATIKKKLKFSIFADSMKSQNFSLHGNIINYILKNPHLLHQIVIQKLYKTCKYFFSKNPIIFINNAIAYEETWNLYYKNQKIIIPSSNLNKLVSTIWINENLISHVTLTFDILEKIGHCKNLNFSGVHLFYDDILRCKSLNGLKTITHHSIIVQYPDGEEVSKEKVSELFIIDAVVASISHSGHSSHLPPLTKNVNPPNQVPASLPPVVIAPTAAASNNNTLESMFEQINKLCSNKQQVYTKPLKLYDKANNNRKVSFMEINEE